jgi:hypothetical protein
MVQAHLDGPFTYMRSDGRAYYMYLPSLLIDGDLDFFNEIQNPWNLPYMPLNPADRTELGYIKNIYPIGFSLSIMPAFLSAHVFSLALNQLTESSFFEPNGYSILYQVFCTGYIMILGILSLFITDHILVNYFGIDGKKAGLAVITFWTMSHYAYYFFREPFMVHVTSGFWVTLVIFLVYKIEDRIKQNQFPIKLLFALILASSMGLICRPTNIFLFFFLSYLVLKIYRCGFMLETIKWAPVFFIGLIPILLQMATWYHTTGHFVYYSYGDHGFFWKSPALWQTLISSRHGLFFWAPILILSLIGVIWYLGYENGIKKPLLFCYLMAFFSLWYANSAWNMWWFGDAFGGRAFLELQGLFIIGLAAFFELMEKTSRKARILSAWVIIFCFLYNYIMMGLYISSKIPRGDYLF